MTRHIDNDKPDLIRRMAEMESDPRPLEAIWQEMVDRPGFIDSRNCGLIDAVESGFYLVERGELFRGFSIAAEDSVLDVGCGAGGATMFCANRGAHVVFTDVVEKKVESLLARVAQTPARKMEGYVTDGAALPITDSSMTRIVAMEVLEHTEDPTAFMRELCRVGKAGALYLLAVPDPVCERMQRDLAPANYFEKPNHIQIFEREAFSDLVVQSGLEIVRRDAHGFFWSMWMLLYWILAKKHGVTNEVSIHDVIQPPYPPLLNDWAKVWNQVLKMPEGLELKNKLDDLLPKSQIIIARKP